MVESRELKVLIPLLKNIGDEVMKIYNSDFTHEIKSDESPLTKADLLSEKMLIEKLNEEFSDYGIISEETPNEKDVYEKERIWLIDPIDGTSDFIQRTDEFSIMIALLENRKPILGVVYLPAKDVFYFALKGEGAYFKEKDNEAERIHVSEICDINEFRLVRSRNHFSLRDERICENLKIKSFLKMGSVGVKFGAIAKGDAEICYYTTDKMGIWDDASSHIILKEAGGDVFDINGNEPEYDLEGRKMKYGFIGTNGKNKKEILNFFSF